MRNLIGLAVCTLALLLPLATPAVSRAADATPAPLAPAEAVAAIKLPEGFRATLVAAEPDVVQPISFCIDDRGRLFVAEALNYGSWQPTGKDRIILLEDRDGDGRAETRKLFYEGLNYVTGIEVGFGGVWAMSPPSLYFIPDRDGDDRPDGPPEVVFDGFGYKESRHNLVNGFTWGPDGWLYFGHGRTSPSDVGRPGTPAKERIHSDGGVCRIHPTRRVFENFADGTTNPWGVSFDEWGQCFVSNCVNPHLFQMIQGGHYEPWRNRPSSLYAYERIATCADHLHYPSAKPGAMRGETSETLAMGGGHAHCGTLIYLGDSFPAGYRNTAMMFNVHGRRINHDLLARNGSGFTASHGKDFMIAGDPWFMGVSLQAGPDGSIFITDWNDTGECHTYKPHAETGRIFKLSYPAKTRPLGKDFDLARASDAELVELQTSENEWHVQHARRLLQERAAKPGWNCKATHAALRTIVQENPESTKRLRALWALHVTGGAHEALLAELLTAPSDPLRAWVIQLLCEQGPPSDAVLEHFPVMAAAEGASIVRLYLAAALQRLPLEKRWPIAQALAKRWDASDPNIPLILWYGIEPLVPTDPERALAIALESQIPLVRQFIARRLADHAVAQGERADLTPWVQALAKADSKPQRDLLLGARQGLAGRKSLQMPQGWSAAYAVLAKSSERSVRSDAVLLALIFGDPQAIADLKRTVESKSVDADERREALEALVAHRTPDLAALLHAGLTDKDLRRTALRGLASIPHAETPGKVLAAYPDLTPEERQDAVATLAARKDYALVLLDAVEKKTVPRGDLSAFVARQLYALGDAQVSERLKTVWGEVRDSSPKKQEQLARFKSMLTAPFLSRADLANGKALYQKTCQNCHKLYGEGGAIGPDLTGSNRANLEYLLSNLVDPSGEIAQDYRMSIVVTADGRVITGMIVEKSPNRLVVQTATERVTLAPDDVEETRLSPLSMMPEGQLDPLTKEQVRDLIAYLQARAAAPAASK